jgi:hypothetical protein
MYPRMFTKSLAAWLVVLAISPFTAPFKVCDMSAVIGPTADRHSRPANELEQWFVDGGASLDFPVAPAAGEVKVASLAMLGTVDFIETAPAAPLDAPPVPAIPIGRAPTLTVLRL